MSILGGDDNQWVVRYRLLSGEEYEITVKTKPEAKRRVARLKKGADVQKGSVTYRESRA